MRVWSSSTVSHQLKGDTAGRAEVTIGGASDWLYASMLHVESVSASGVYVMVDKSDAVNFPHTNTGHIMLKRLELEALLRDTGRYNLYMGVVTEADGTDGSTKWVHVFRLDTVEQDEQTQHRRIGIDFTAGGDAGGLSLEISGGAPVAFVSNAGHTSSQFWQNDTARTSPVGTSMPDTGDLVAWLEEIDGDGSISFTLTALYSTET